MTIPPAVVDELFVLAHAPTPWRAMAELLAPHVGGGERAVHLARAWMPEPLRAGTALPGSLPDGTDIPPARTPWPRAASPVPGADLDVELVLAAAIEVLAGRAGIDVALGRRAARGREKVVAERAALRLLTTAVPAGRIPPRKLRELARRWDPLPCVRLAHPPRVPPGWLDPDELDEAMRGLAARTHEGLLTAWRLMVLRGAEPVALAEAIRRWRPGGAALPTGQWCEATSPAPQPPPDDVARRRVDLAIAQLLAEQPLHWALLARATIVADERVGTMAVGLTENDRVALFFAPPFVLGLTRDQIVAVLLHEIHHVIFGHLDATACPEPPERATAAQLERRRVAWLLACEATANEPIHRPLPGKPVTIERLGLPPDESTTQRFERLLLTRERPPPSAGCLVVTTTLAAAPRSLSDTIPRRVDTSAALRQAIADLGGALPPDVGRALRRELGDARVEAWLARSDREPALSWTTILQLEARSLGERRSTRRWPSRRRPEALGIVAGKRARRGRPVVLAAIDTSASLSREDLAAIRRELGGLERSGARVAVLQCDTEVRAHGWLGDGEVLARVVGRGGTDLRPPFAARWSRLYRPELIVVFTDGGGPAPRSAPRGCNVLWVLTGAEPRPPTEWGRVVWMA
jgi:predicted metal-dependent peptidase